MLSELRLEKRKSLLQKTIDSLPAGAGSSLQSLNPEIPFYRQKRPCDCCGQIIVPKSPSHQMQRFCNYACSAKWWMQIPERRAQFHSEEARKKSGEGRSRFLKSGSEEAKRQIERIKNLNPMNSKSVREKASRKLLSMKHKPRLRGGNGHGPTVCETLLLQQLGADWINNFVVKTGPGILPNHYKIDVANPSMKIAIEVDGTSHSSQKVKQADARKQNFLTEKGWIVLRFSNRQILNWIDSEIHPEHFISTTLKQHGINHSA